MYFWGEITFLRKKTQIFRKYFSYLLLAHFNISQYFKLTIMKVYIMFTLFTFFQIIYKITFINSNKHILAEYDEKTYVLTIGPNSTLRGPTPSKQLTFDEKSHISGHFQ
jgi:hypothetical protein